MTLFLRENQWLPGERLWPSMVTPPMWSPKTDANHTCEAKKLRFSFGKTTFRPQTAFPRQIWLQSLQQRNVRFTAVFSIELGMGRFLRYSNSSLWGISIFSRPSWPNLWFSFGTRPLVFFALRATLCEPLAPVFTSLVLPSLTCSFLMASHGRQSADFEFLRVHTATCRRNVSFPVGKL